MFGLSQHVPRHRDHCSRGCLLGGVPVAHPRHRHSAEERERLRREHLVRSGRIIDGTILDISELEIPAGEEHPPVIHFILYQYAIGGVTYECSQDLTSLRDLVDPTDLRSASPARFATTFTAPRTASSSPKTGADCRTQPILCLPAPCRSATIHTRRSCSDDSRQRYK